MGKIFELEKIKYDKKTKEESLAPFSIYKNDIICFYKDKKGVFIITKQGYMHKMPYSIGEIKKYLEM